SKVWQAGQAAGDVLVSLLQIIWFIVVFALTTLVVIAALDWRMLLPVVFWLGVFAILAYTFVPRIRDEARRLAMETAIARADLYASAAGYRVARIVTISEYETRQGPQPMLEMAMPAPWPWTFRRRFRAAKSVIRFR
ncbi:MAG: SIMPL domain-containing protein, partial [Pseudomonadota bacterium]